MHPTTTSFLEQAETKAMLAIESASLGTYELYYATDEMHTSERFNAIWDITPGLPRAEIARRIHPDDLAARSHAHVESIQTGSLQYEARIIHSDGSQHWVRVRGKVLYTPGGVPDILLGIVQDITEQRAFSEQMALLAERRTEELQQKSTELQASEDRYHKMIAEVEDYAILFLDRSGIIQNWNKGAEKIKGYKEHEIIGKSFKLFYLPEDRKRRLPESLIERAILEGKAVQEGLRMRKDGTTFWGSIVITALHDNDNKVVGFSKVTRDLTERKAAEDKIHQYARELELQNKELKQFAFVASHDMKEPLRKIIYNNNYLNDRIIDRLDGKEQEALRRATEAARRMKALIDDILSYSHTAFADHEMDTIDLDVVLREVLDDLKEEIDRTGTRITCTPMPVISGIRHQISQIFSNLINNAIKYRHAGRRPEISIGCTEISGVKPDPELSAGSYHRITVSDNGIGFSNEYAEKIFELFYRLRDRTAEAGGSGIGLSICRKIAQNHKGHIHAAGMPGDGSTFELYLPARQD